MFCLPAPVTCFAILLLALARLPLEGPGHLPAFPALSASDKRVGTGDQDPAKLFAQGMQSLQSGDLAQAATAFATVARLDPSSAAPHSNLGVIAMRQRHWNQALTELRKAQQLDPSLVGIRLNIGLVYYRMNEFSSAVPEFSYVLAHQHAAAAQARYLLGLSLFFADRYQDALTALLPLWEQQSKSLTYLYVLGSAAHKAQDDVISERAFRQMAEVGQGTPEFHLYAGKASLGKQEYAQAETELTAAIAMQPNLPMAHFFLAQAYSERHQDEKARDALLDEIRLEPEVAFSYDELGRIELKLGDAIAATKAFQSALARDPTLSTAYVGLAQIYRDQQQYGRALAMLDQAVAQQPNSGSVHYLRGQTLARLHRDADARAEFHTAEVLLHALNEQLKAPGAPSHAADAQTTQQAAQE